VKDSYYEKKAQEKIIFNIIQEHGKIDEIELQVYVQMKTEYTLGKYKKIINRLVHAKKIKIEGLIIIAN